MKELIQVAYCQKTARTSNKRKGNDICGTQKSGCHCHTWLSYWGRFGQMDVCSKIVVFLLCFSIFQLWCWYSVGRSTTI